MVLFPVALGFGWTWLAHASPVILAHLGTLCPHLGGVKHFPRVVSLCTNTFMLGNTFHCKGAPTFRAWDKGGSGGRLFRRIVVWPFTSSSTHIAVKWNMSPMMGHWGKPAGLLGVGWLFGFEPSILRFTWHLSDWWDSSPWLFRAVTVFIRVIQWAHWTFAVLADDKCSITTCFTEGSQSGALSWKMNSDLDITVCCTLSWGYPPHFVTWHTVCNTLNSSVEGFRKTGLQWGIGCTSFTKLLCWCFTVVQALCGWTSIQHSLGPPKLTTMS